jgi:DNA-binding LacI/PurR family transcriptional regulator
MNTQTKHTEIAKLIKHRIDSGEWLDGQLPGERALAAQIGVSYMTARKAIRNLLADRTLVRLDNGRLQAPTPEKLRKAEKTFAFVAPAFESISIERIRLAIEKQVGLIRGALHVSSYKQWHDAELMGVFDGDWDGIFVLLPVEGIERLLLDRLQANRHRVVSLYRDMSEHSIVSLDNSVPGWASMLVEHLSGNGHQRVDCFNTQPGNLIKGRLAGWLSGITENNLQGHMHNYPVEPFENSVLAAYHKAHVLLKQKQLSNAVFCTTINEALGLARAGYELGYELGKDLQYCTWCNGCDSALAIPSITTLTLPDYDPFVRQAIHWLEAGDDVLGGELFISPEQLPEICHRESTGASRNLAIRSTIDG